MKERPSPAELRNGRLDHVALCRFDDRGVRAEQFRRLSADDAPDGRLFLQNESLN